MRGVFLSIILKIFHLQKSLVPLEKKGLIIILVDGLGYKELSRTLKKGYGSFFLKLLKKGFRIFPYFCGVPASTTATEAELFFGTSENIPGFTWFDRSLSRFIRGNRGESIIEFEQLVKKRSELLMGGSCVLGIYSSSATQCDLSGTQLNLKYPLRALRKLQYILFIFLNPLRLILTLYLILKSLLMSIYVSGRGRSKKKFTHLIKDAFSRIFLGNIASYIAELEIARETPVLFIDFVLYDEFAHEYGVNNRISYSSIRLIDWYCKSLYQAAKNSKRKYDFIVLSDHGQAPSNQLKGQNSLENMMKSALNNSSHRVVKTFGFPSPDPHEKNVYLVPVGSTVHIYFSESLKKPMFAQKLEKKFPHIIDKLLKNPEIGWILIRSGDGAQSFVGRRGTIEFKDGKVRRVSGSPLTGFVSDGRVVTSLARYASFENNGDLVLFGSVDDGGSVQSFEDHRGTHGGFYGDMTEPFILTENKSVIDQLRKNNEMGPVFESIRASYGTDKL